jgi:ABC-2 type transport system ATP-binding protein
LTKRFGDLTAVDQISFEVGVGEIFGFLGPNGSGKSTTVRMLTGTLRPDKGTALIMGHEIAKETLEVKEMIGVVPEVSNAYTEISAWKNLMLVGELYGLPRKERVARAESLLDEFGLYDRRDGLVRGFSKGMKQRLILCMALINDPPLLFLDEPSSGLDVESKRLIEGVIREKSEGGTTVFLTTHDIEEANQLCDRVAIINRGSMAAIDRPEALKRKISGLNSIDVSFDGATDHRTLERFCGSKGAMKMGDKIRLWADDVDEAIGRIATFAASEGLKIVSLNTLSPSLEEIFVELTKRRE